jgi:SNF2 family DNA or RNA helicase
MQKFAMNLKSKLTEDQQLAVDFLLKQKLGALFMTMGKGKTLVILRLFEERLKQRKVNTLIVFLPLSTKNNFEDEIKKHYGCLFNSIKIYGIESISQSDRIYLEILNQVNENTMLVFDESTKVKNIDAIRTQRSYAISKKAIYKLISTGTPITKYIKDLYSQFLILSPNILGYKNFDAFKENHLEIDRITGKIVGSANYDYLKKLIEPFAFNALTRSHNLILNYKKIEYKPLTETQLNYEKTKNQHLDLFSSYDVNSIVILAMLSKLQACVHDENRLKALKENIPENDNIIIICRYNKTINDLYQLFQKNAVILNGEHKDISLFLSSKKNILLANIGVGALGLNLQHANHVFFYENVFDYYLRVQAECRIARPGQKNNCFYYDFSGGFGIEKMISSSLRNKRNLLEEFKINRKL